MTKKQTTEKTYEIKLLPGSSGVCFRGLPYGDTAIDVTLRPATRRDRAAISQLGEDVESGDEKLIALLCTQFGDRPSVTSLELLDEKCDELVSIVSAALLNEAVSATLFRKPKLVISVG
jgi:hypothetical protein